MKPTRDPRGMHRWDMLEDRDATEQLGVEIIGAGVRRRRLLLGLSQQQLAWRVGVSQSVISRLETGRLRGIRFKTVAGIVGVLDVSPSTIFPGEPPPPIRRRPGQQAS